jgi:L,D-transpeptidase YcbB
MQRPRLAVPRMTGMVRVLGVIFISAGAAGAQETSSAIEWPVVKQSDAKPSEPSSKAPESAATETAKAAPAADNEMSALISAVRLKLADAASNANKDDVAAATEFYSSSSAAPLWVSKDGLTAKATAVIKEFESAADWGLEDNAFDKPRMASGASPDALAAAEVTLSLSALKYARFARGGRLNPPSLSRILDMRPPVKDPKTVIADLAASDRPAKYLLDQHPRHEQFQRLRQALLKSRGPAEPEQAVDEAMKIKLPKGKTIKKGAESDDIALLRKRAKDTVFDAPLSEAVTAFQVSKGLTPTGTLTNATRTALNAEGEPKKSNPKQNEQRLIVNMEKWRWMPDNLGNPYVWNNIPEFQTRTVKDGKEVFKEKIIVGMPEWATPVFAADMEFVIFYPSWGVPDGIKTRELLPRLQKAGGGGFFDQLFGGGGGSAGVMKAYGLTAYRNGKVVDPNSINPAEIRSYSFVQPSGGANPLGIVKFRFPNPHDVYMHDTTQRNLFGQSYRAMSHGCIRVQNPIRFAEVLLGEDRGWSPERVKQSMGQGDITLEKKIPVYMTYFTAMVDDAGRVSTYGDLYGHDGKISRALGRDMDFDGGNAVETASFAGSDAPDVIPGAGGDSGAVPAVNPDGKKAKKDKNSKNEKQASKKTSAPVESMSDAVSGLLNN